MQTISVQIYLTGLVQGVGMRRTVYLYAKQLGVKGFVRNLPDGRVEVFATGTEKQLQKFIRILEKPPVGKLDKLEKTVKPKVYFEDFTISD